LGLQLLVITRFTLGADTSKEVQVTNCIAISLTEVFGAGNEPTKEEMDTLIRQIGWFEGTRTLKQTETTNWLLKLIISVDGAGFHNSIYRGKNLGTSVTPEQWARISLTGLSRICTSVTTGQLTGQPI
jgi:hypothetical protein